MKNMKNKNGNNVRRDTARIKFGFGIFMLAFMLSMVSVSFASLYPKVQLQNYSISEIPAQPGHLVNLTLVFRSIEWDNCAENTAVQISTSYPLSVDGTDIHNLGYLCSYDPDNKSITSFILPVDSLAASGTYQVAVITTYEMRFNKFSESNIINLRVGGVPSFTGSVSSSKPVDIYPGDSAYISLVFQNNGTGRAESVRATFNASKGIEVKWAGQTQELGQITARGSSSSILQIDTPKTLSPGMYKLYATLEYASEDKTQHNASFVFDLPIAKKAAYTVENNDNLQLFSGDDVVVNLTLVNSGYDEAKNIKARIQPIYPFSTDGTVRYIASLEPGEKFNLTYTIHVDKDATVGKQLLTLMVSFENPDGNQLSDSADFSLSVKQKTLNDRLMELWYIGAAVLLMVIWMLVKKIRTPKK